MTSESTDEIHENDENRTAIRSFSRDTSVIVAGNLITGAVLWLLAVVTGLIRSHAVGFVIVTAGSVLVLTFSLGALMITVGGYNFMTSGGDSGRISGAKSTAIYGLIILLAGLLIAGIVSLILFIG